MKKYLWLLLFFLPSVGFAGNLEVSQFMHGGVIPKNGVRIPFLTVTATARSGDVKISSLSARRNGLSEDSDISSVTAITNQFQRSLRAGLNDGEATLRFRSPVFVPQNESVRITIYGNISMEFPSGRTIFFVLEEINSDAENVTLVSEEAHPIRTTQETFTKKRERPAFRIKCKNRICRKIWR